MKMSIFCLSVAERTRLQESRKRNREMGFYEQVLHEVIVTDDFRTQKNKEMGLRKKNMHQLIAVDDYLIMNKGKGYFEQGLHDVIVVNDNGIQNKASMITCQNVPCGLKARFKISKKLHESSFYESKEEGNNVKFKSLNDIIESADMKRIDDIQFEKGKRKRKRRTHHSSKSRKEKNHLVYETNMQNEKTDVEDNVKKVSKASSVKHQETKKGRRKSNGVSVKAILDSIIMKKSGHEKEGDDCIPLKFRFDESEDETLSQETNDFGAKGLFEEMDFALDCEKIGSYKTPTVENGEKNKFKVCQRGEHGDIYFEEQTGMRCTLCGVVLLESKYVIPKLANYVPDKSKRSYIYNEHQLSTFENLHLKASNCNDLDIIKKTNGTVWELIPPTIRPHLYPHQEEGFKFLWENFAGTIELSRLNKTDLHSNGGGCIISHAPGTGKTFLTIVFIESFLKKFPKCCPVIIAPASMLLTWEAEFKKWQVGVSFINLNSSEFLRREEKINGGFRPNKQLIRAMKISSWSNGRSVLGVSYHLYEKLAGGTENNNHEKMGNVLLYMPGLVVLDEGHTPRNQNSKIWKILLKLTTKNRVILSGTPFQNNFKELFNTLRLVRPETANKIVNEKIFADMIHQNSTKKSKDIEKLKVIISPFVHVHRGHILENKLPGLKQRVLLLNPPPFQKGFIKNIGKFTKTFEYEHKVALLSVHPSLIFHCSLSKKEKKSLNKQELEKVRLCPQLGVKTRFVMELVRLSISLHEKVLIFSQYIQPLELLKDQMTLAFGWDVEREMRVIKGITHPKLRQTIINDFNDPNSSVKVLLASTRCCSEGIHLHGASRVVLLDVVWNPSVERQAISRAYRLGQRRVVYTYHLMTAGTTEEEKYDRQVEKGRLAEMVFSSACEEQNNKLNGDGIQLDDKILEQMVDHQQLKHMFKKITYVENQTRN